MVLLFHGEEDLDVADTAWGVRDYGAGKFGNWAFNVAYAGEQSYNVQHQRTPPLRGGIRGKEREKLVAHQRSGSSGGEGHP